MIVLSSLKVLFLLKLMALAYKDFSFINFLNFIIVMSIKFKTIHKVNPQNITVPKKHYACVVSDGSTDLEELAEIVATQCTVSPADCYAVLIALESNIIRELKNGRIIHLGKLGSYRISVSSEGKDTAEEVVQSSIKKAKVLFNPGLGLRNMLKNLNYKKSQNQVA
jgi:predicted histone-like DNA-binding protein